MYTANSIQVVLKKRKNVEYERERLAGNYITFIGFLLNLKV